ncbi:MAG: hypothetical protein LBP22_13160 [Deltaproteobacteria bacterium]|jgi:hypothetical protein|nr:hypothetical protein [Deltaproteobacteria bacterium]
MPADSVFFLLTRDTGQGLILWLTGSLWLGLGQWAELRRFTDCFKPALDSFFLFELFFWVICEAMRWLGRRPQDNGGDERLAPKLSGFFSPFDPGRGLTRYAGTEFLILLTGRF